jgi:hypothetical protein
LVQQNYPSCIFFKAKLAEDYFACANHIQNLYQPDVQQTIFKLNTDTGYLETPKMSQPIAQNLVIVSNFKLTILLENFWFSPQPFTEFSKLEVKNGCFYFPLILTCRGNPKPSTTTTSFSCPAYARPSSCPSPDDER